MDSAEDEFCGLSAMSCSLLLGLFAEGFTGLTSSERMDRSLSPASVDSAPRCLLFSREGCSTSKGFIPVYTYIIGMPSKPVG